MFAINLQVNPEAVEALYQAYHDELLKRLNDLQGTVFEVPVEGRVFKISFKLEDGEILLFSEDSNGFDDYKITLPRLRLNVSRHFLPDSLNMDGSLADPFQDVGMGCELSSVGGLDSEDTQAVMAEIAKIGFLRLVGLKK